MASIAMNILLPRVKGINCVAVGPGCPVSESIYGYQPSLAWNALFLAIFGVSTLCHVFQGIRYRTWSFLIAMGAGGIFETIGEGGRLMLHKNPYSDPGFKLQIVLLTFSPAFLAAGVYLQLKHLILTFGSSWSLLRPSWYTYLFITCDILSIALQGAGGGLAAAAQPWEAIFKTGNSLMKAGLCFQVATLVIFGVLASEYVFRTISKHKHELNPATESLRRSMVFKDFIAAIVLAYVTILIRCCYRVAELAGGWSSRNHILHEESLFLGLDSFMIAIAMISFNLFHPGRCLGFKKLATAGAITGKRSGHSSDAEMGMQEQK